MPDRQAARQATKSVTVRTATLDDCAAINAIYNFYVHTSPATFDYEAMTEEWRANWFAAHQRDALPVLVAEAEGEVAGWCSLTAWSPKPAYRSTADESIYIADAQRGRGVGRALVSAIVAEAQAREIDVVMAVVVASQAASLGLHRSLGFEDSALNLHMGYKLGSWHDVVTLQRHLWRERGDR